MVNGKEDVQVDRCVYTREHNHALAFLPPGEYDYWNFSLRFNQANDELLYHPGFLFDERLQFGSALE
jgi:hypothetical protein